MRGVGGTTLRGGQTVFHGIRMWGQLLQAGMMLGALIVVAVPAWNLWHTTTGADWYAAGMLTLAEVKLAIGYQPDSGQVVRDRDGVRRVLSIRTIASSVPAARIRERIRDEVFRSAWLGGKAGAGVIALFLAWFWYRGVQLGASTACGAPSSRPRRSSAGASSRSASASWSACRAGSGSAPTGWPASRSRPGARPSTRSSRAPPARARRC